MKKYQIKEATVVPIFHPDYLGLYIAEGLGFSRNMEVGLMLDDRPKNLVTVIFDNQIPASKLANELRQMADDITRNGFINV